MHIGVIIAAAGWGRRFAGSEGPVGSGGRSKVEVELAGRPVFLRSVELFLNRPQVRAILLAVAPDTIDQFRLRHGDKLAFHGVKVVPGGRAERWETVLAALAAVPAVCTHVAVHDAARPLASAALIDRVFEAAGRFDAVVPGLAVRGTLKRVCEVEPQPGAAADPLDAIVGPAPSAPLRRVVRTVDRRDLVEAQTPQVFAAALLRRAYDQVRGGSLDLRAITDDAALVEALGEPVHVVDGESANLKITQPEDLRIAEGYLQLVEQRKTAELGKRRLFGEDQE